jgi:predicted outer membrane repeat protein
MTSPQKIPFRLCRQLRSPAAKPPRKQSSRPALESLENRLAPAFFVNSAADILIPPPGVVTLRSAIAAANAAPGDNVIELTVPGIYRAVHLDGSGTGAFGIDGNSSGSLLIENTSGGAVTVDANQLSRVFSIDSGGPGFTVSMTGFTITGGLALGAVPSSDGGAILNLNGVVLNLSQMVLTNNTAASGGAVFTTGTMTLVDDLISNNQASGGNGGAIETVNTDFATVTVTDTTVAHNVAAANGGAIDSPGLNLVISGSTFDDNIANGSGGGAGGGAVSIGNDQVSIANSTLFGNSAPAGEGGAINSNFNANFNIINCTIDGNSSGLGGGIAAPGGTVALGNTIVAGNTAAVGPDVYGSLTTLGHNLVGITDGSSTAWAGSDLTGSAGQPVVAGLGSLANNGGPTETQALLPNSLALDAGDNTLANSLSTDQRGAGFPRIVHFTVDIGAFESAAAVQAIITLATADNFYVDSSGLFENAAGGQEKWLRGRVNSFGNPWYYILPGGAVYAWNGTGALGGTPLVQAGNNAWQNPELLVNASALTAANPAQVQAADQQREFFRSSAGNFYAGSGGVQEVWIEGLISAKAPADQNNPWYFILQDGSVHEWDGRPGKLTGPVVAGITPDPNLWKQPWLLYDAYQNPAVSSGGLAAQYHFYFSSDGVTRNLYENVAGADEKWFRGDENAFGNTWYFLLPSGKLYAWNGSAGAAGTLLGQLSADAWNDIEKVVGDFAPVLAGPAAQQLTTLDTTYGLFRGSLDGNFSYDALGEQEKWLSGVKNAFGNDHYYLKADGTLTAWNGLKSGTVLASNLPPEVYADPLLLADAYADGAVLGTAVNLNPFGPNQGGPGDRLG